MGENYTEEKLNNLDKETIIRLFLAQQDEFRKLDHTLQLVLEQVSDLKRHRFGRSTERHETDGQILFMEVDGNIVFFNEAEAVAIACPEDTETDTSSRQRPKKDKGNGKKTWPDSPLLLWSIR